MRPEGVLKKHAIELKPQTFKDFLAGHGFKYLATVQQTEDDKKLEKAIYIYVKH